MRGWSGGRQGEGYDGGQSRLLRHICWCPSPGIPIPHVAPKILARPASTPTPPQLRRSQSLPELLECAYGLLRAAYLSHAWQLLQGAASWQAAEAALYLLSTVSLAVKARVLGDAGSGGDENAGGGASVAPAVAEDRRATQALLGALFGRVCSPEGGASMLGTHPALAQAACRLVEHYSSWFARAAEAGGEEPPLQGAFQLLLRALRIPQVRSGGG